MSELNETIPQPLVVEVKPLPESLRLKPAADPLNIREGELAVGPHLRVVQLANCLGVGLKNDGLKTAVAAHIGPFGGEKQGSMIQIDMWAMEYVEQLAQFYSRGQENPPTTVIVRSRQIGSRPLFHGRMIKALKTRFPGVQIDMQNGTEFEIEFQ